MSHTTKRRGFLARAGALLAVTALALSGVTAAQAADIPDSSTVTITKLSTPPTGPGLAATGIEVGETGGPVVPSGTLPIAGVQFEAYAVPVVGTPGTNEWQQNAGAITLAAAQTAVTASPNAATFALTNGSGVTTWTAPRGLYLIREVSAPEGVTPAGDFLLSVPLTDPQNRANWLTNIFVYPKNSRVSVTKTVNEGAAVAVGENVTWTVLADIPRDDVISKFEISDTFDMRLTPLNATPNTPKVSLTGATNVTLTGEGVDYTVTISGQKVTLAFTEGGLAKLVTAWNTDPTAQVQLEMPTLVNDKALLPAATTDSTVASIINNAILTVNNAKAITSLPATLKLGDIKIAKRNSATDAELDAVFSVYRTEADAKARVNAIAINGKTEFESVNGELTISGLFFSNYVNGAAVPVTTRDYWVNEVKAPEGFQLLAAPINTPVIAAGSDNVTTHTIKNTPNTNGFQLPLTGGTGTAFLTIGGIAILAAVMVVARRRRHTEASAE